MDLKDMIMRQTDYTAEIALENMAEYHQDPVAVIREYLGRDLPANFKKEPPLKTINQQIYQEIRHLMDDAATTYREKT